MFQKAAINNELYKSLGNKWYQGNDYIGLLRSEAQTRNPWIMSNIQKHFKMNVSILDIGCGGGLLSNSLCKAGYNVTGVDIHDEVLEIARAHDSFKAVKYVNANALNLPFENASFDVVCAMDFLEHVDDYRQALKEGVRVLKKNGIFFFHTFNRNFISWLFVIKGMEWFVKNTPKNLHVYHLFIKPNELLNQFAELNCKKMEITGLSPQIFTKSFIHLLLKGNVDKNFNFKLNASLLTGYIGYVKKL